MQNTTTGNKGPDITELLKLHMNKKKIIETKFKNVDTSKQTDDCKDSQNDISSKGKRVFLDEKARKSLEEKNTNKALSDLMPKRLPAINKPQAPPISPYGIRGSQERRPIKYQLEKVSDSTSHARQITTSNETTYMKKTNENDFPEFSVAKLHSKVLKQSTINRVASDNTIRPRDTAGGFINSRKITKATTSMRNKNGKDSNLRGTPSVDLSVSEEYIELSKPAQNLNYNTGPVNYQITKIKRETDPSIKSVKFSEYNQIITYKQDSIIRKKYKICQQGLFFCF